MFVIYGYIRLYAIKLSLEHRGFTIVSPSVVSMKFSFKREGDMQDEWKSQIEGAGGQVHTKIKKGIWSMY